MEHNVTFAFVLTLLAGLSTGIGSLIALLARRTNRKFLSFSLGFSAGVMTYISFVDLFPQAAEILGGDYGVRWGRIATAAAFFGGILFIALIDKLVPSVENPHEIRSVESMRMEAPADGAPARHLMRTGVMMALVIGIHNFPEGIATFMAALQSPEIGLRWRSPFTISRRGLRCRCRSTMPRGAGERPFSSRFSRGWPNRSVRWSGT